MVGPNISAYAWREIFIVNLSEKALYSELAHDPGVKSVDDSVAREFDEFDRAFLPWFKSHRRAGGDVQDGIHAIDHVQSATPN